MTILEIQKTIDEQKLQLDKAAEQLQNAPEDIKIRREKILQLVKEELTSVANEIAKYADKF
jgi:sRNA-binding carbon storage regulator CsrA